MEFPARPRLCIDGAALAANWRRLARLSGAAECGAAVKADGYGLGAHEVAGRLARAGCRDFFVSSWAEASALRSVDDVRVAVLHGVQPGEMPVALASRARPVLCTAGQVAAWRAAGGGSCDVMVDTGINRLGLTMVEAVSGLLDGLAIDTLHSHLACADTPAQPLNRQQQGAFAAVAGSVPARRCSLANSAGIMLGADFHYGLTRPGIALYGGNVVAALDVAPVVRLEARIVQVRHVAAGQGIGYGGSFITAMPSRIAVLALGYADGYRRALSNRGSAIVNGIRCPVAGRVSMDLVAVDATRAGEVADGDWAAVDFDLAATAAVTGASQYELLTGLGDRYSRIWT